MSGLYLTSQIENNMSQSMCMIQLSVCQIGVPQSSMLAQLLFLIYVNDLNQAINTEKFLTLLMIEK